MKTWVLLLVICGIVAAASYAGNTLFMIWVYSEPDEVWKIEFVCATGRIPYPLGAWMSYDNGTHTIDMKSCGWIANADLKHPLDERDEIRRMSCQELAERHDSGVPYRNNENRDIAEFRISTCDFIKDWEMHKKQPWCKKTCTYGRP